MAADLDTQSYSRAALNVEINDERLAALGKRCRKIGGYCGFADAALDIRDVDNTPHVGIGNDKNVPRTASHSGDLCRRGKALCDRLDRGCGWQDSVFVEPRTIRKRSEALRGIVEDNWYINQLAGKSEVPVYGATLECFTLNGKIFTPNNLIGRSGTTFPSFSLKIGVFFRYLNP